MEKGHRWRRDLSAGLEGKGPRWKGTWRERDPPWTRGPVERGCNGEDGSNGEKVEKEQDGERNLSGEGLWVETTPTMERP